MEKHPKQTTISTNFLTAQEIPSLEDRFKDALIQRHKLCFNFEQTEEVDTAGVLWLMSSVSRMERQGLEYEFQAISPCFHSWINFFNLQTWIATNSQH